MDAGGVASARERIRTGQREQSSICKDLISIGKDLISICKEIISRDTPPPKKKPQNSNKRVQNWVSKIAQQAKALAAKAANPRLIPRPHMEEGQNQLS